MTKKQFEIIKKAFPDLKVAYHPERKTRINVGHFHYIESAICRYPNKKGFICCQQGGFNNPYYAGEDFWYALQFLACEIAKEKINGLLYQENQNKRKKVLD